MKRIVSWVTCLLLIFSMLPVSGYSVETEYDRPVVEIATQYDTYSAVKKLKEIVDIDRLKAVLTEGFYNMEETVDISAFGIPDTETYAEALRSLIFDEMWENIHFAQFIRYSCGGIIAQLEPEYNVSAVQYHRMLEEIAAVKDSLVQDLQGLGEAEKALLLHDRLALRCEYDFHNGPHQFDYYGALVEGTAVCQGYAEAYAYLLEEVGVEHYLCTSAQLYHAWNVVYIQGVPYHVDVTWDDVAWDNTGRGAVGTVSHNNFLRSSEGIYSTGHTADDYDTLPQNTKYDNWFWQDSNTAFVLVDGQIYYIDNQTQQLKCYSDGRVLCDVSAQWDMADGYWQNQACLATDGEDLYYSLKEAIYRYDLSENTSTKVFEPELSGYNHIYSFAYTDGALICDISNAPPAATGYRETLYQIRQEILTLSSISVKTKKKKNRYVLAEALDLTGLELTATYSDNTTKTVTDGFTVSGYDANTLGEHRLTVTYKGKTATFTVIVGNPGGTCGDDLTWELVDGVLTVSGTGAMYDYTASTQPWKAYRETITGLVVGEGVTSIGASALYYCRELTQVHLPATVKKIANKAFYKATSLTDVYYDGTALQWELLLIGADNTLLTGAAFHFKAAPTVMDVSETSWQFPFVQYALQRNLMAGKGTDAHGNIRFDPNSPIAREEFVQVLYNAEDKPAVTIANPFPDVMDNGWYRNAVLWAKENNIANGGGDGNFGIGARITRQDLALMLCKYASLKGCSLETETGITDRYGDKDKISGYAKDAMDWAVTNGILSGKGTAGQPLSSFRLDPTGTATRAECAAMLRNFMTAFGL